MPNRGEVDKRIAAKYTKILPNNVSSLILPNDVVQSDNNLSTTPALLNTHHGNTNYQLLLHQHAAKINAQKLRGDTTTVNYTDAAVPIVEEIYRNGGRFVMLQDNNDNDNNNNNNNNKSAAQSGEKNKSKSSSSFAGAAFDVTVMSRKAAISKVAIGLLTIAPPIQQHSTSSKKKKAKQKMTPPAAAAIITKSPPASQQRTTTTTTTTKKQLLMPITKTAAAAAAADFFTPIAPKPGGGAPTTAPQRRTPCKKAFAKAKASQRRPYHYIIHQPATAAAAKPKAAPPPTATATLTTQQPPPVLAARRQPPPQPHPQPQYPQYPQHPHPHPPVPHHPHPHPPVPHHQHLMMNTNPPSLSKTAAAAATSTTSRTTTSSTAASTSLSIITKEQIEDAIPYDASSIVWIFDRRVNLDAHAKDASLYSLLRAWAQDDPFRIVMDDDTTTLAPSNDVRFAKKCYTTASTATTRTSADVSTRTTDKSTTTKPARKCDVLSQIIQDRNDNDKDKPSIDDLQKQFVSRARGIKRRKIAAYQRRDKEALASLKRRGIDL